MTVEHLPSCPAQLGVVPDDCRCPEPVHCWAGYLESLEFGSEEWVEAFDKGDATCLLPDGHEGPHEWTPDSDIMVRFDD